MRIIFIFIITFLFLGARENPFKPLVKPNSNVIIKKDNFTSTETELPDSARVLKSVTLTYQNMDGTISNKLIEINQNIDWHNPIVIYQKNIKEKFYKLSFKFIKFYIKKHKILIVTHNKKIRDFFLIAPYKLVIDFKANLSFLTMSRSVSNSFVKKITIGNHDGFYRVVILLDGRYIYSLKKSDEGYLIEFK